MAASEVEREAAIARYDAEARVLAIKFDLVPREKAVKFIRVAVWIGGAIGFVFGVLCTIIAGWL
jgi:hypothetical protein